MNEKDIIKLTKVNNVRIKNLHNGVVYPPQDILKIETREGTTHIIDLMAERDITFIDYFEVTETPKTKERILFMEHED